MRLLLLALLLQVPTERQLLEAEHARVSDAGIFERAAASGEPRLQRLALRALGRLEDPRHAAIAQRHLRDPDAEVRREAINALGQMRANVDLVSLLEAERAPMVRAALFETIGRIAPASSLVEATLAQALAAPDARARAGAMRGLESYLRRHARSAPPAAATISAITGAFPRDTASEFRQLALLALAAAAARDSVVFAQALRDPDPQVRRLAVAGSRQWVDDTSALVRYQALRVAGNCDRARAALADADEHVRLLAIDQLGERRCDAALILPLLDEARSWRTRAHAVVALAKVDSAAARLHVTRLARAEPWQLRAHVATAARALRDSATLSRLARDADPNVAAAALETFADARAALASGHAGLLLAAATRLKDDPALGTAIPLMVSTLGRLSGSGNVTYRDARVALLDRIEQVTADTSAMALLRTLRADRDPVIAAQAARIIGARTGTPVAPATLYYRPAPLPAQSFLDALRGARAELTMRGRGRVVLELLSEVAPVTVATFAALADSGRFDGLGFHRIVPNFVVQGASPGANEYDGLTTHFMRDELGFARNARGSVGVSTRGRDTGDGQIYINLVDNFRLDHDYTVFARVLSGMSVVDGIEEGDVIESVRIIRAPPNR